MRGLVQPAGHTGLRDDTGGTGAAAGVNAVHAGTGVTVTGTATDPIVNATGATFGAAAPLGPTAVGALGAAASTIHSDASAPAYRSDLPLSTAWFIDPVNGSDAKTNPGTTSATALKTLAELSVRLWGAEILSSTTINILGNVPSTDRASWNFTVRDNVLIIFQGSLGPTTGFGGAAIDNTLFAGTVTTFTAAAAGPAADDIELTDATIPASFTASGLMAAGVLFRQTAPATTHWYALKDLGAKTIRLTAPMNTSGVAMSAALTNGSTYVAYQMWTLPSMNFGPLAARVALDSLLHLTGNLSTIGGGVQRTRVWEQSGIVSFTANATAANVMFAPASSATVVHINAPGHPGACFIVGGGTLGTGAGLFVVDAFAVVILGGAFVSQGREIQVVDSAELLFEAPAAVHDTTVSMLTAEYAAHAGFDLQVFAGGLSGKGNTGKIVRVLFDAHMSWDSTNGPQVPLVAGSTTDAAPVLIGLTAYTVAQLATVRGNSFFANNPWFPQVYTAAVQGIAGGPLALEAPFISHGSAAPIAAANSNVQRLAQQPPAIASGTGAGHLFDAYAYDAVTVNLTGNAATGPLGFFHIYAPTINHTGTAVVAVAATMKLDPPIKSGGGAWTLSAALYIDDPNATGNANLIVNDRIYTQQVIGGSGLGDQNLNVAVVGGDTLSFLSGVALDGSGGHVEAAMTGGLWQIGRDSQIVIDPTAGSVALAGKAASFVNILVTSGASINVNQALAFAGASGGTAIAVDFTGNITLNNPTSFVGAVQMGTANIAANAAVATVLTGVGPAGAHTTVQEWLVWKGTGGVTRYTPGF